MHSLQRLMNSYAKPDIRNFISDDPEMPRSADAGAET